MLVKVLNICISNSTAFVVVVLMLVMLAQQSNRKSVFTVKVKPPVMLLRSQLMTAC